MIPIIVIGNQSTAKSIHDILSRFGVTDFVTGDCIRLQDPGNTEFCVYSFDRLPKLYASSAVIVFADDRTNYVKRILPVGIRIVTFNGNRTAEKIAADSEADIITCGFADSDTITLSSNADGRAAVSVNGEITTLCGNKFYPGDIVIDFSDEPTESELLFSAALLILCDKLNGCENISL